MKTLMATLGWVALLGGVGFIIFKVWGFVKLMFWGGF